MCCESERKDTEHTFFECNGWTELLVRLEKEASHLILVNVIDATVRNGKVWDKVAIYMKKIL